MPSRVQAIAALSLVLVFVWLLSTSSRRTTVPAGTTPREPHAPKGKASFRQRLVAVGDLHGDLQNAQKVLRMVNLINDHGDWKGSTDILVQTGDIVDRGTYALDIYKMMQKLRGQAASVGGQVISILGNHEVMNAIGDWRYVTPKDIQRFGSTEQRQYDLSTKGWLGQEWLANYSTTALVPLGKHSSSPKLSFTHGSLRPSYSDLIPYPKAINDLGHSLLTKALTPPLALPYPPNPYSGLPKSSTPAEAQLYDSGGPYWWRGLAEMQDEKVVCGWAKELQRKIGAKRIIGGHTPNLEKIVDRCNASIIIIDTGISSAYGGVLSALEIIYTLTPISTAPDHRQDPFVADEVKSGGKFIEREEVYAVYETRKDVITIEQREITL